MKKLLNSTAFLLFCFLVSCQQSGSNTTTANSDQANKNKQASIAVYRAFETGNVNNLDSFIDKDIVDHSGENGEMKGIDSMKKMITDMHTHMNDIKIESIANATDGDYNFDLNRMTGTTNSPYMGFPANYKFDMMGVDVVKVKNGKAVEHWGYADPNQVVKMMQAMGSMPGSQNKMDSSKHK
jgi:predicted SnoaL-like aldol condensation-catalyzing enzyme